MPKGTGAAAAFAADEDVIKESQQEKITKGAARQHGSAHKKVTIVLSEEILYAADYKVLQLKRQGMRLDRSSYIAELIERDTA